MERCFMEFEGDQLWRDVAMYEVRNCGSIFVGSVDAIRGIIKF